MNTLCLKDWDVLDEEFQDQTRVFTAEYAVEPEACPKCGVVGRLYKHGTKEVEYKDTPAFGKKVIILASVKRFRCRECGATSMQKLPDMHHERQMTQRCAEHLIQQCRTRTYAEMSRETGVEESVIRALCNAEYDKMKHPRRPLAPTVLGIDELTLHKRRRCIFVDVVAKRTLDLLADMGRANVVHLLSHLPEKDRIQVVTMDMWDPYRLAVRGVLPKAQIVVDKWHIQKKANDALDRVRARHRRGATRKADKKNPWRIKRILMARRKNLKPQTELLLDGLLKNNPLVSEAYHAKEAFYDIWEVDSRADAERAFEAWVAAIPEGVAKEFGEVRKTVENWRGEIFAYFDHRYTNAFTEAMNGLVKIVNRAGRGYSFDHIRAKVLSKDADPEPQIGPSFVCDGCGGQFQFKLELHVSHLSVPASVVGRARLRNGIALCPNCHRRFHAGGEVRSHDDSTSKTG